MPNVVDTAGRRLAERVPDGWPRSTVEVLIELMREFKDDRVTGLAAEVAFYGVLALFPGFIAVAAAVGSLETLIGAEAAAEARESVVSFLQRVLTSEASGTIEAVQSLFEGQSTGVLTVGLAGAIWAMSRGFAAVINALDVVYDLEERRSFLRLRGLSLLFSFLTVLVAAVMLAMLVVGPLLGTGHDLAEELGFGDGFVTFWNLLRWPVTVAVLLAWATALFHFAPNHRTPWRWDLAGAVVATVAWLGVTLGFRAYLSFAGGANQVLGALGGALIVLVWLYLLGLGLLVGGEINAILAVRHRVPQPGQE